MTAILTLSGWVECAGIADRSNFDLTVHSGDINVKVKREIEPRTVYELGFNRALGQARLHYFV